MRHRPTTPNAVRAFLATALLGAVAVGALPVAAEDAGAPPPTTVPPETPPATTVVADEPPPPDAGATPTTEPDADTPVDSTAPAPTPDPAPPVVTPPPATAPAAPAPRNVKAYPEQIEYILATIRYLESRGIYTLPPNLGDASGAYQFIGSTWNNYGGYPAAYLAPPHIQDERAAQDVLKFLDQWNNDVSMVPVMWYLPAASRQPELMDVIPKPQHGNKLTIREYQTRWLGVFAFISGQPLDAILRDAGRRENQGRPPVVPDDEGDAPSVAFPVLGPVRVAVPECDDAQAVDDQGDGPTRADVEAAGLCADQAPSVVFGVKLQPILVAADGVVTAVDDEPWSGRPITVAVTAADGLSYVYSGFNDDNPGTDDGSAPGHLRLTSLAAPGTEVRAGQVLGFMGDTDPLPIGVREDVPTDSTVKIDPDAVAPHLRLSIVDLDGRPVEAFGPVIDAIFRDSCSVAIGPWSVGPNGSGHESVTIETIDDAKDIDSEWVITSTGQVRANGWAAMINPNENCRYTPDEPHGPGAAGFNGFAEGWDQPVDLPTDVWVTLAMQSAGYSPDGLIRRG